MLAAERVARHDPQCGAIFRQQRRRKHARVAVSHVAHKLVHVIFAVLTHRWPYELPPAYRLGIIEPVERAATTPDLTQTGTQFPLTRLPSLLLPGATLRLNPRGGIGG
jgi:hypothetical protein